MRDAARYGAHYHVLLGMEWALEWILRQQPSPSHVIKSLMVGETADVLAKQHDLLLQQIDALVRHEVALPSRQRLERPGGRVKPK